MPEKREGNQVQCRDFRELADSYLSDELLVETNHDVIKHLESCAGCRRELAARRNLRSKLRSGFEGTPDLQASDEFQGRLTTQLREVALSPRRLSAAKVIAIAASVLIVAALGLIAARQGWRSQSSAGLDQSAAGDHRDCALNHRLAEAPIDLEQAGRKYDRAYINLVNAVMSDGRLPSGVELVGAHSCVFKGRRFGHVILTYRGQLVSVLVTNIETQNRAGATAQNGSIADTQVDNFQLARFETTGHAVYVVSSLSETENLSIAQALQPSLSRHITDAERASLKKNPEGVSQS
jgi:anti-sigma factor RsiW